MAKTVQIPIDIFFDLYFIHCLNEADPNTEARIQEALEAKFDSMVKREYYSKYKDKSLTAEEREKARKQYLDAVGMNKSFRW